MGDAVALDQSQVFRGVESFHDDDGPTHSQSEVHRCLRGGVIERGR